MTEHLTPEAILAESCRIIEREVGPHGFTALEWPIVRRMIHASGDVELVRAVCFEREAAAAGVRALRSAMPIVTDVRMVAAGIDTTLAQSSGTRVHCFIDDPEVQRNAAENGRTRSYWAMVKAIREIGAAVYVVGNAPTALDAIVEAVRQSRLQPALVIAAPVGFVGVIESKEQALALPVPVLAVRGRKGGSAVAAAAINALLHLAAEAAS